MKFALLGCDPDTLGLALAIARHAEHELAWAHDLGSQGPTLRAAAPGILQAEHWEGLLGGTLADVVIVSRANDQEERAEQLRKLAQVGTAMIVSHPAVDSMLVYYELDMIRQESRAVMLPYVPQWWNRAWGRLAELVDAGLAGPLGALEQIVVEHGSPDRRRADVLQAFVRDMEALRPLCGALNKVSAMTSSGVRANPETVNYGTFSVQMASLSNVLVRWSVSAEKEGARCTLLGTRGKAVLDAPRAGPWQLQIRCEGQDATEHFDASDAAETALPRLVESLNQRTTAAVHHGAEGPFALAPDWIDACRTMELADAAEHSLQRGRTIELHYETPSEQATFKGVMSGVGCLLLMAGLVVLIAATTAVHAGAPLAGYWPYLLLGVLLVFLLLQCLRLVFPSDRVE